MLRERSFDLSTEDTPNLVPERASVGRGCGQHVLCLVEVLAADNGGQQVRWRVDRAAACCGPPPSDDRDRRSGDEPDTTARATAPWASSRPSALRSAPARTTVMLCEVSTGGVAFPVGAFRPDRGCEAVVQYRLDHVRRRLPAPCTPAQPPRTRPGQTTKRPDTRKGHRAFLVLPGAQLSAQR